MQVSKGAFMTPRI